MVIRLKLTPYYISLAAYCMTVFFICAALRSAADNIRENAAITAQTDNYIKQDLALLVAMRV